MNLLSLYTSLFLYIENNLFAAWLSLVVAFIILSKCADLFVESAVSIAHTFKIPKLIIGIVLVSLATTTPELTVSLMSALSGKPEMALGNAIGSVICDDGLALGLAGLVTVTPILVIPQVLKTSGVFLIGIECIVFLFIVSDNTLNRWEGFVLLALFAGYMVFLFLQNKKGHLHNEQDETASPGNNASVTRQTLIFVLGLVGIIISSKFIIISATTIAHHLGMPESIIALTIVAFGTSIPEVATCVVAARKNHGAIAVGNIIGADIMNICWVAGASAVANPLVLGAKEIWFMFPSMFVVVGAMLALVRYNYSLTRTKGAILLGIYLVYLYLIIVVVDFPITP